MSTYAVHVEHPDGQPDTVRVRASSESEAMRAVRKMEAPDVDVIDAEQVSP